MGRGGLWEATAGALNEGLRGLRGGLEWVPRGGAHAHLCDPAMGGLLFFVYRVFRLTWID